MIHRRQVLEVVAKAGPAGLTLTRLERELLPATGIEVTRRELESVLEELEERGELIRGSGKAARIVAIEHSDCFVGTLRSTSRGFGVVRLPEPDLPDIVVPPEKVGAALDGDVVLVQRETRVRRGRREVSKYGEVVRILRRRRPTLVGRFMPHPTQPWVDPYGKRVRLRVLLEPFDGETPRAGEFVEVAVGEHPEGGEVSGRLLRRLGAVGEPGVDEDVVLAELAIPIEFSPAALAVAAALPAELDADELGRRTDHRDQPAVTIDPETARDHDDAVVAFPAANGGIEVFVHIADVSHYVLHGSALDAAARERGTSVYLPGRCVPMLPERLSSDLCSLLPGVDRFVFTVRFVVTANGAIEGYRAERAVFRSRRRCHYGEVFDWLEHGQWPTDIEPEVRRSLELLSEAAERLGDRRHGRGSIDFDLPEAEILLDPDGFMTGVVAAERNRAHRLIEELMLAANEAVARMLVWGRQPGLFRVHERPSAGKLAELQALLAEFDIELKGNLDELPPRALQRVLDAIKGRPEERFLQTVTLRSLARAAYLPACKGHYALATEFYLHFTSPIRRYPDLVVHRFLADLLAGKRLVGSERALVEWELDELAPHCSMTERRAEEAEREVVRWKQAEYMRSKIGELFGGHVSGVVAFGVFVQLDEVFVEGLVHISELRDDFYTYDELGHRLVGQRSGRVLRLGDALRARVTSIDDETMEVRLEALLPPLEESRGRVRPGKEKAAAETVHERRKLKGGRTIHPPRRGRHR
jgi:ribonuclease R